MPNVVTVTSSKSWFSRLAESFMKVLFGILFFVVAFPVLWWNEGRAVTTERSLDEGAGAVVSVPADTVDKAHEGALVHLSGPVTTDAPLVDETFGVEVDGVRLLRTVEMYQWKQETRSETRKKLGGGEETVTTYTYSTEWDDDTIDSSSFQEPSGHENPGAFPFESASIVADPVHVGAFLLAPDQAGQLRGEEKLPMSEETKAALPAETIDPETVSIADGMYYLGGDPAAPQVGDSRVVFEVIRPATVSVIGVQNGDGFSAYQAKAGDAILMVEAGTKTAAEMFQAAQSANTLLTWFLRFIGWFFMFIGLLMIFKPLSVVADVVPLVGTILGAGLGLFSFMVSVALSFITIAIAWIFVRPLLGIGLLLLAAGGVYLLVRTGRRKKAERAAVALPPLPVAAQG